MNTVDILNIQNYTDILLAFKNSSYRLLKFPEVLNNQQGQTPFALFRHDVDFSIKDAFEIAKLEKEFEVRSTFFFHLRSPLYNLLSSYAIEKALMMFEMGHDICLHFDMQQYGEGFHQSLLDEFEILKKLLPFIEERIVSFHRVGKSAFELDKLIMPTGISHTYERKYFKELCYHSDSGGSWKRGNPIYSDDFKSQKSMQILTHPMWWIESGVNPIENLTGLLNNNRIEMINHLGETVISYPLTELK